MSRARAVFGLVKHFFDAARFEKPFSGEKSEWVRIIASSRGECCPVRLENPAFARKRHGRPGLIVWNFGSKKLRSATLILLVWSCILPVDAVVTRVKVVNNTMGK
jgi:hypothetical protein